MAKKLISICLSAAVLIFSSISVFGISASAVTGDYFLKQIVINGESIQNEQSYNPFVFYGDLIYVPVNAEMGEILGYSGTVDWDKNTLELKAGKHIYSNVKDRWTKNNLDDIGMTAYRDMKVTVTDRWSLATETLDLKGYPLLGSDGVIYLPLTTLTQSKFLNIKTYYDFYGGISITTTGEDPKVKADASAAAFNKGAVDYIKSRTGSAYGETGTLDMVLYFKKYGSMYGVDPTLLMAVAGSESGFRVSAVNSQNGCGLMQIMASTGQAYGFSKSQLLTAKGNIQMGAIYISNNLKSFGGSVTKALSAYNMGAGNVKNGKIASGYVSKVTSNQNTIKSYLANYGYKA